MWLAPRETTKPLIEQIAHEVPKCQTILPAKAHYYLFICYLKILSYTVTLKAVAIKGKMRNKKICVCITFFFLIRQDACLEMKHENGHRTGCQNTPRASSRVNVLTLTDTDTFNYIYVMHDFIFIPVIWIFEMKYFSSPPPFI